MPFQFNSLLHEVGIDPAQVRLLRHQPKVAGRSLIDIWRAERTVFDAYQSLQAASKRAHFARPYWATFIGTWDGRTVFAGMSEVGDPETLADAIVDPISGVPNEAGTVDRYPVRPIDALRIYEGKLYIDWGGGSAGKRAWVQRAEAQDKIVNELHLANAEQPFPGFLQIAKPLSQLADLPPGWIEQLSAAKGIYLLACPRDGSLYVGSATGPGGFWDRWTDYRTNGHGGNVGLVNRDRSDFTVSILQVAGSSETYDDITGAEQLWKTKLGSRSLGLNRN